MEDFLSNAGSSLLSYIPWFAVSIFTAILIMSALPMLGKLMGNISLKEELAHKDNFAAGLSLSGTLVALGCVIAGASAGDFGKSFVHEVNLMLSFGLVGIVLLLASRFSLDKLSLRKVNLHDEIMKENTAAGIADMGNTIASGLVLFNVMVWADSTEYFDIVWVVLAWAVSQVVLFLATVYRNFIQRKFGGKISIQEQLKNGNVAVAIRFAGYRISIALAMMATTSIISFDFDNALFTFIAWSSISIIFAILTTIIGVFLRKILLRGVDVWDEVENQGNIGIAAVQAALFIVGSLLIIGLNM
jgi:uncharacterized membrane protein YjfL (UPF0719 family)